MYEYEMARLRATELQEAARLQRLARQAVEGRRAAVGKAGRTHRTGGRLRFARTV